MSYRKAAVSVAVAAAIAAAPISSASAHDHWHGHGGGLVFGLFAAGAAVLKQTPRPCSTQVSAASCASRRTDLSLHSSTLGFVDGVMCAPVW